MSRELAFPNIKEEIEMTYDEYVKYLINKYGAAEYDYFCNENCKSKNKKNSRTAEGLFCHHIDENKWNPLCKIERRNPRPRIAFCYFSHFLFLYLVY